MKYFWTHRDNIPEGLGYGQFTPAHFLWIAVTFLCIIAGVWYYLGADTAAKLVFLRSIGAVLIAIDLVKMVIIARSDVVFSDYLPLELCSFAAYFIVIDSLIPDNTIVSLMLVTLFLPAALMAIFFPTTSPLPAVNFYTIHQFLYHGLIVLYVAARFAAGEIPLSYPMLWGAIFRILILAGIIYLIDVRFNKNFMFLRETYGNPVLEIIWNKTNGGTGYTAGLVCFCVVMIHVFFAVCKIFEFLFLR